MNLNQWCYIKLWFEGYISWFSYEGNFLMDDLERFLGCKFFLWFPSSIERKNEVLCTLYRV